MAALKTLLHIFAGDKTKMLGIRHGVLNTILLTLLILLIPVMFVLHSSILSIIIVTATLLVLVAISSFISLKRLKYQQNMHREIYEAWYFKLGAPNVSTTRYPNNKELDKKARNGIKTQRRLLKIAWNDKTIETLTFQGEPANPNYRDLKEFEAYITSKGLPNKTSDQIYAFDFDALVTGQISCWLVAKNSQEGKDYIIKKKLLEILENVYGIFIYASDMPHIEIEGATTRGCSKAIINGVFDTQKSTRTEKLLQTMEQIIEPGKDRAWRISPESNKDLLVLEAVEQKSDIIETERITEIINNLIEQNKTNSKNRFMYVQGKAKDVKVVNGELLSFTIQFRRESQLSEKENLMYFVEQLIKDLSKTGIKQKWKIKNRFNTQRQIIFSKQ